MPASDGAGLAAYDEYMPSADLRPFVRRFLHGYTEGDRPHRLTIPPSGGMFLSHVCGAPLHVHLSDRTHIGRPRLFIGGQLRNEAPVLESLGRFSLIGTEFTPTGFHRLFRLEADGFTDGITEFADVRADDARMLAAELAAADAESDCIASLDRYLCGLVDSALETPLVDACVEYIHDHRGMVRVEDLADRFGSRARQLHRHFLNAVGVGPKHYAKIVQLNAVVGALTAEDTVRLNAAALDCGYYDQSHFIRDFRRYIGSRPMDFLRDDEPFLRTYLGKAMR